MSRLRIETLEDRITPGAGDLDPTFGSGGVAVVTGTRDTTILELLPSGGVAAIARLTDLTTNVVVAYRSDGTPDLGFGTAGQVVFPGVSLSALAAQPDGKLLLVGRTTGGLVVVTRLTVTGQADPAFGTNGTATAPLDADPNTPDNPLDVAIGPSGVVVVAGNVGNTLPVPIPASASFAATRLMADGTIDSTFGVNGMAVVPFPVGSFNAAGAQAVAVQADGRLVLAGQAVVGSNGQFGYSDLAVMRLTTDGQLDNTFGTGGRLRLPRDPAATAVNVLEDVAILPDNRILVAGVVSAANGVSGNFGRAARLLPDGSFDSTYGIAGLATGTTPVFASSIGPDSRVIFTGFATSRLTDYGFTDSRFITGSDPGAVAAEQPDGQVVFSGQKEIGGTTVGVLTRVLGNGPPPGSGFLPGVSGMIMAGGAFSSGGIQVLSPTHGSYAVSGHMSAFPGMPVTARSTIADVTGDGIPDYVIGSGPGNHSEIAVFDGQTYNVVADFLAFEGTFTGGVFVAAADLDGDLKAELVISPDQGGGPRVVVFSIATGGAASMRASFFGFDDPNFRGGARVALGDVNNDGTPDLAVAAGFLGGPRVALLDGTTILGGSRIKLVDDFFAFPGADAGTLRNGTFLAIGDLNGDSFADLIFGGGPGGAPRIFILDGRTVSGGDVAGAQANPFANFFVDGSSTNRGGIRVAAKDADGDALADLAVGSGEGSPAIVRVYLGKNFTSSNEPKLSQDIPVGFDGSVLRGGVYVG